MHLHVCQLALHVMSVGRHGRVVGVRLSTQGSCVGILAIHDMRLFPGQITLPLIARVFSDRTLKKRISLLPRVYARGSVEIIYLPVD